MTKDGATQPNEDETTPLREDKVTKFFSYHLDLAAFAARLIKLGEEEPPRNFSPYFMGSMIFSAFALEALANAAGERWIPKWTLFEGIPTKAKVVLVSRHLGIEPDFSSEPWQTIADMITFRNRMAHGKPIVRSVTKPLTKVERRLPAILFGTNDSRDKWTVKNARRYRDYYHEVEFMWQDCAFKRGLPFLFGTSIETSPDQSDVLSDSEATPL